MNAEERVRRTEEIIKEKNLDAEVIRHPETPVINLDIHLKLYKCTPDSVMKGLIFTSKGKFVAVIASGDVRINIKKLKTVSGLKKPRMANEEELAQFGLEKGAIGPTTVPKQIPTFIDKKLLEKEEVVGSAGSPTAGLRIKTGDILKVINAKVVDLSE
jgi:prolyl-tRNA editing enzyme YbaK/EbsC (Cys-tRNA(Pro) deacylase)